MRWGHIALLLLVTAVSCRDPYEIEVLRSPESPDAEAPQFPAAPDSCSFPLLPPDPIVVVATPASSPDQVRLVLAPLIERLARTTGLRFELQVPKTYADLEFAILSGKAHLAIAAPLTYVEAKLKDPCTQLLLTSVSAGFSHYSAYFLVRADAPYSSLEDLRGVRLAMLGPQSASGSLYPQDFFKRNGIDPETYFSKVTRFDTHLQMLHALQEGTVDLVPTYSGVFAPARREGVQMNLFRVFAVLERIPNDALVASSQFPRQLALEIADAIYSLNAELLTSSRWAGSQMDLNGWIYTQDSLYNPLRRLLGVEEVP